MNSVAVKVKATFRADKIITDPCTAAADFTYRACRIADDECIGRDVIRHNRSGTDHAVSAKCMAADDGRISPDGCAFFNFGFGNFPVRVAGTWILVIRKGSIRPDENVIFNGNTVID